MQKFGYCSGITKINQAGMLTWNPAPWSAQEKFSFLLHSASLICFLKLIGTLSFPGNFHFECWPNFLKVDPKYDIWWNFIGSEFHVGLPAWFILAVPQKYLSKFLHLNVEQIFWKLTLPLDTIDRFLQSMTRRSQSNGIDERTNQTIEIRLSIPIESQNRWLFYQTIINWST